ncbi:MAG: hypothetical protein ABIS07_15135 [Dokdonella sp.]
MQGSTKSLMLAAALALVGAAGTVYTAPAEARVAVSIYAPSAPPALRVETVPAARAGYVWAPGYWAYGHRHYNWRRGHFVRARHGYNYNAPRWEQDGNRWRYHREEWGH